MVSGRTNSTLRVIFNVLWLFLFGWELAVGHFICAVLFAITIVGILPAKQHIKLIPLALLPFGGSAVARRLTRPRAFTGRSTRCSRGSRPSGRGVSNQSWNHPVEHPSHGTIALGGTETRAQDGDPPP